MCDGKITGIVKRGEATREQIGLMMMGVPWEEVSRVEA
jgi:ABC-type uncharacterized transport system ATPase subunit